MGLDKILFERFNKQLELKHLIVEKGTIVDATIKQAPATPKSNKDQDAIFTRKLGKTYYGYKGHISIDEDSLFIKPLEFTKASVHDSKNLIILLNTLKKLYLLIKIMLANQKERSSNQMEYLMAS